MPTISEFNPSQKISISSGASQANIDTSGAGVIAKSVAQLGQEGANLANQMLLKQKVEQADIYAQDWTTRKSIDRQQKEREFRSNLQDNPDFDYLGAMAQWEDDSSREIEDKAPTDLAKTAFLRADSNNKTKSLIGSEMYIFNFRKEKAVTSTIDATDMAAKRLQSLDADYLEASGSNIIDETLHEINEANKRSLGLITKQYLDPNQGIIQGKELSKSIAVGGVNGAFTNDRLQDAAKMLDFEKMLITDEFVQAEVKGIINDITGKEIGKVTSSGTILMAEPLNKEDGMIYFDIAKGAVVDIPEIGIIGAPPEQKIDKIEDNPIVKSLTQQQHEGYIQELLRRIKDKNKESLVAFRNRTEGLIGNLSGTDKDSIRYDKTQPDATGTRLVHQMMEDAKGVFVKDPDAYKDWVSGVSSAIAVGEFKDTSTWDNERVSENRIANSRNNIMNTLDDLGLSEMKEDPLFVSKFANEVKTNIDSFNQKRLRDSIRPEYVYENDSKSNRMFNQFKQLENTNPLEASKAREKLKASVGTKQDSLGIPKGFQSIYPEEYLTNTANILNSLSQPETGYVGKQELSKEFSKHKQSKGDDYYGFIKSMKNLNPELVLASFYPETADGLHARSLMIDSIMNYDNIRNNYIAGGQKQEVFVTNAALKKLTPYMDYLRNSTNTSEAEKQINTMTKALSARAMLLEKKGASRTEAVDRAYSELFSTNFHINNYGGKSNIFYKSELAKAKVTPEIADAAIKYFSDIDKFKGQFKDVKLDKYVPEMMSVAKTPAEKNIAVKDAYKSGGARVTPIPDGDALIFRITNRDNFWSEPVVNDAGESVRIPFKRLNSIDGVVEESKKTNWWGF